MRAQSPNYWMSRNSLQNNLKSPFSFQMLSSQQLPISEQNLSPSGPCLRLLPGAGSSTRCPPPGSADAGHAPHCGSVWTAPHEAPLVPSRVGVSASPGSFSKTAPILALPVSLLYLFFSKAHEAPRAHVTFVCSLMLSSPKFHEGVALSLCHGSVLAAHVCVWQTVSTSEKAMALLSSTLAWRIPGAAESGGLQSMGSQRVRHD